MGRRRRLLSRVSRRGYRPLPMAGWCPALAGMGAPRTAPGATDSQQSAGAVS